ncbi:hypothetical protein, partial [Escherichia coli]
TSFSGSLVSRISGAVHYSGDVTCSVVTYSQLPESIQVQAQLKQPKLRGNVQTAQRAVAP